MIHSKHSKQGFGGVDPDAPHQMIPEKCSPKNAPQNKMLPGKKWFPSKCSPSKCSPKKNAPPKKCSPEKFSGFTYHGQSQRYVNPENSFKSVDEGRLGWDRLN